jgi:uncharacterized protein (DUF2267 family)
MPVKMDKHEFLDRVRQEFRYEVEGGVELLVTRVLDALRRYAMNGEWDKVRSSLPQDLRTLVPA